MKKLLNSATRFLTISLALVLLLTVCIFSFLAFFMSGKSAETISAVGTTYMTGMGETFSPVFLAKMRATRSSSTVPISLATQFCSSSSTLWPSLS